MMQKLLLSILFLLFAAGFGLAQNQLKHEKKVYHDKSGRVYINQELPLYFFFSTSKQAGSKKHQLKSEITPDKTDPVKFNEEGHKSVTITYTKSANGGRIPVNLDFYVDGTVPESNAEFASSKSYTASDVAFFSNDLKVTINATDEAAGIADIYYSLGGGSYQKYSNALTFSKEGKYSLKYYAVDNVGNVETAKSRNFTVDATKPTSKHIINGPSVNNTFSSETEIVLSAQDNLTGISKINFKIDNQAMGVYEEAISLKNMEDGKHEIVYYATDNLGLEEDKQKNKLSFYLDLIPPEMDISVEGTKYTSDGFFFIPEASKIKVSAKDNHSGIDKVFYKVIHDGSGGKHETSLKKYQGGLSFSENGKKTIIFKAFDKIGNVNERTKVVYLDNEKPKTGIKYGKPQIFTNDTLFITLTTKVELFTTKYDSGIKHTKFSINGGPEKIYKKNNLTFDQEGTYRVQYYSVDNVGNQEMKKTALFNIDNTPPSVELVVLGTTPSYEKIESGKEVLVFSINGVLKLDAKDRCGVQDIYYWLNDGPKMDYSKTRQINVNEARNYKLKVQATDNLGNTMTKNFKFYVIEGSP